MKYCQNCGAELYEEAVVCPKCGCSVQNSKKISVLSGNSEDSVNIVIALLSFFVPLVGLVFWAMKHKETPNSSKAYLVAAIIGWVLSFIIVMASMLIVGVL